MSTANSNLHSFDDNNTIENFSGTLSKLMKDLQIEKNKATDWFKMNNMIVNPEKFQTIIIAKKGQNNNTTKINIDVKKVNSERSVLLLGLEIDSKLIFDKHIFKLYNKSADQLNGLN